MTGLLLLPLLEKVLPRRLAHVAACSFLLTVAGGVGVPDRPGADKDARSTDVPQGPGPGRRSPPAGPSRWPTREGIPPEGSAYVLGRDPLTRGGELFGKKCQGCHDLGDRKADEPVGARPEGLRLVCLGPRAPGEARRPGLLRQGPPVRRDDGVEGGLEALGQGAGRRGRLRRQFADDPARRHARRVGRRPGGEGAPRPEALPEGMRRVPHDGRPRREVEEAPAGPRPLRLGLGPLDGPDDQASGSANFYGYLEEKSRRCRPSPGSSPTPTSPPWSATSRATMTAPRRRRIDGRAVAGGR